MNPLDGYWSKVSEHEARQQAVIDAARALIGGWSEEDAAIYLDVTERTLFDAVRALDEQAGQ